MCRRTSSAMCAARLQGFAARFEANARVRSVSQKPTLGQGQVGLLGSRKEAEGGALVMAASSGRPISVQSTSHCSAPRPPPAGLCSCSVASKSQGKG